MPDRTHLYRLRRPSRGLAPGWCDLASETTSSQAQRRDHDRPVFLNVAVQATILCLECGPHRFGLAPPLRHRNPDRPQLAGMMQLDFVLQVNIVCAEPFSPEHLVRLGCQCLESEIDLFRIQGINRAHQEAAEVLPHIGVHHPDSAQCTGRTGHVDARASEPTRDRGAMHRPRTPRRHQGEAAR